MASASTQVERCFTANMVTEITELQHTKTDTPKQTLRHCREAASIKEAATGRATYCIHIHEDVALPPGAGLAVFV